MILATRSDIMYVRDPMLWSHGFRNGMMAERDVRTIARLLKAGWRILRIWSTFLSRGRRGIRQCSSAKTQRPTLAATLKIRDSRSH